MMLKKTLFIFATFSFISIHAMEGSDSYDSMGIVDRLRSSKGFKAKEHSSGVDLAALEEGLVKTTEFSDEDDQIDQLMGQIRARIPVLNRLSDETIYELLSRHTKTDMVTTLMQQVKAIPMTKRGATGHADPEAQVAQLAFSTQFLALFQEANTIQKGMLEETKKDATQAMAFAKESREKAEADGKVEPR